MEHKSNQPEKKKFKPSKTKKDKKKYDKDHFDKYIHKDFITEKTKSEFKHICDNCANKKFCKKGISAIILKCEEFKYREARYGQK